MHNKTWTWGRGRLLWERRTGSMPFCSIGLQRRVLLIYQTTFSPSEFSKIVSHSLWYYFHWRLEEAKASGALTPAWWDNSLNQREDFFIWLFISFMKGGGRHFCVIHQISQVLPQGLSKIHNMTKYENLFTWTLQWHHFHQDYYIQHIHTPSPS